MPAEHGWLTAHLSGAEGVSPRAAVRSVLALPAAAEESVRWRATEGVWSVDTHVDLHLVIDGVGVVLFCFLLYINTKIMTAPLRGDCPLVRVLAASRCQVPRYSDIGHTIFLHAVSGPIRAASVCTAAAACIPLSCSCQQKAGRAPGGGQWTWRPGRSQALRGERSKTSRNPLAPRVLLPVNAA